MPSPVPATARYLLSMTAGRCVGSHRSAARGCLLLVIMLVVAACGGSGNEPGHSAASGERFAGSALSACASPKKSKSGWSEYPVSGFIPKQPDVRQLPQVG